MLTIFIAAHNCRGSPAEYVSDYRRDAFGQVKATLSNVPPSLRLSSPANRASAVGFDAERDLFPAAAHPVHGAMHAVTIHGLRR